MAQTKPSSNWLKDNLVEILALVWSVGGLIFLFCAASGKFGGTESLQTQVVQGIFGILILITSHYWRNGDKKPATTIQTQDNAQVTVGPNMGSEPSNVTINDKPPEQKDPCKDC